MQNGSIGEARAKAFLMDRFWILERSIDINGADFIIQLRLTNRTLLDRNAPKLGFVQVKFSESKKTTHYLPKEYIYDKDGKERRDFFLLLYTGFEEDAKAFLLTSDLISVDFKTRINSGRKEFVLPTSKIIGSEKYLIKSKTNTLNRIEENLKLADFLKNRNFISWHLPSISADKSAILPDYKEAIDNSFGDIPNEFTKIKEWALEAKEDIEDIYWILKEIIEEIDPLKVFDKIVRLMSKVDNHYGNWGQDLTNKVYNEEFYYTVKNHKDKIEVLKRDNLLDEYLEAKKIIAKKTVDFLKNKLPISPNLVHSIEIKFSVENFEIKSIKQELLEASEYFNIPNKPDNLGFLEIPKGMSNGFRNVTFDEFEYFWWIGRYLKESDSSNPNELYRYLTFPFLIDCLDRIYEMKYYE